MKTCNCCGVEKPKTEFYKNKSRKDGFEYHCKECSSQQKKKYYTDNKERILQRCAEYAMNSKDERAETHAKYYNKNKETILVKNALWRKDNKVRMQELVKEWSNNNRDKRNTAAAKSRANKRNRIPDWLSANQKEQIKKTYSIAAWLTKNTGVIYEVDHVVPLHGESVSGLHVPWNLQVITKKDNRKKSNKWQS